MKIKDLVNIKDVRTVVQMADIKDPNLRDFLTESFVITDEVKRVFYSFFNDLVNKDGKGYFIEGNFGSGKSHLLSVLSLLINYEKSWQHILSQNKSSSKLQKLSKRVIDNNYITINLSLVEHSNKEYLEDIVIEEIINFINKNNIGEFNFKGEQEFIEKISEIIKNEHQNNLNLFLKENNINEKELFNSGNLYLIEKLLERLNLPYRFSYNRQQIFEQVTRIIDENNYDGLVILIDELSEFLRSKPDGRRFNEDIRFLQFLGEYSKRQSCWILATLQEEIEKTGETTPEAFNKIKDRYPNRFYLTGQHIKELIHKRLIELKTNKKQEVINIYEDINTSFPDINFSQEDFLKLYPVHPQAIDLLDNLKPLFSQHRGIIDFIHYRLKGDSSRNIDSMMDLEANNLLTPDKIFDHFVDRIREMMETSPFYTKVYKYYKQEIDGLLDSEQRETGMKIIKLLILFSISPINKRYNVKDITNMLLEKITDLEPNINYEYIEDILNRLYQHGAYLVKEKGEQKQDNKYYIDLEADVNLIIKRRTEYIKSNLFENDKRLFTKLGQEVKEKFLPLNHLFVNSRQKRSVTWQNTERSGFLYFIPVREISVHNIKKSAKRLTNDEEDFMLIISYALDVDEDKKYLENVLLPELTEEQKNSFSFWFPNELKEKDFLEDALAQILLIEKYEKESSKTSEKIKKQLQELISEKTERVSKIFRDAYFNGTVVNGFNENIVDLNDLGFLPFQRFLDKIVANLLRIRYPDHKKISPYQSILSTDRIEAVLNDFISKGDVSDLKELSGRALDVIDNFMKPMGLIKKRKNGVRLTINPGSNQLIKSTFSILENEQTALKDIYWKLRKGSYGLSRNQFKLLIYALLYSGYLTAYSDKQKISLKNLNARNFNRIKSIGYGELINEEYQAVLSDCSLLPNKYKKRHFSLPIQQEIWQYLIDKKKELLNNLDSMLYQIERFENDDSFKEFNLKQIISYIQKVKELLSEIMVSYSSEEGLERFANKYRNLPNIENYLTKTDQVKYFLNNNISDFRMMKNYLTNSNLDIPNKDKYESINSLKESLLMSLSDESVIYDKDFFSDLKNMFEKFKQEYIDIYQKEHDKEKGINRFKPLIELKNKEGYQILKTFSALELISVKDDLIKVDRLISNALSHRCNKNTINHLNSNPICECGFKLDDHIELPSIKKLQSIIDSGIKQYVNKLKEEKNKEKIIKYLENMEAAGNKRFAKPIRNLLNLNLNSNLYNNLDQLLNRNVIKRINTVLSGNVSIVERSLDDLYENLIDRSFSYGQIKEIFKEWLQGSSKISDRTYIKVKGNLGKKIDSSNQQDDTEDLIEYLNKNYPDLLSLINNTDINLFIKLFAVNSWKNCYHINTGLDNLVTELIPEDATLVLNELKVDSTVAETLDEAYENMYFSNEQDELKEIITKKIDNIDLSDQLLDIISPANLDELIDAVKEEKLSRKVIFKLLIQFIKIIENTHLDYKEKESFREKAEKIKNNIDNNYMSEYKNLAFDLIINYLSLETGFSYLDFKDNISDLREWKEVYKDYLSNLELNFYNLKSLTKKLNLTDIFPQSVKYKKTRQTLNNYNKLFVNFHDSRDIIGDDETFMGNNLIYLIKDRYPSLIKKMNVNKSYCIMMDGMRWDIWKVIKKSLSQNVVLRLIEEDSIFSLTPTNTEKQINTLKEAGLEFIVTNQSEIMNNISNLNPNLSSCNEIVKFSYIDDKVHSNKDDYHKFIEEIEFQTNNRLIPFIDKIESGSGILIFSDHGYTINHEFKEQNKYEDPRYLHGGKTFHEVIVPWAFMYKP